MTEETISVSRQEWERLIQRLNEQEAALQTLSRQVQAQSEEFGHVDEELSALEDYLSHRITPTQRDTLHGFLRRRGKQPS